MQLNFKLGNINTKYDFIRINTTPTEFLSSGADLVYRTNMAKSLNIPIETVKIIDVKEGSAIVTTSIQSKSSNDQ